MTYYVKINGNPTIGCRDIDTAIEWYLKMLHWQAEGHTVEMFSDSHNITPEGPE